MCVHPPTLIRQHCDVVHHPGYLAVTCKVDKSTNSPPTLHLSWIPNSTLRKYPSTLENVAIKRLEVAKENEQMDEQGKAILDKIDGCQEAKEPPNSMDCERICSGGGMTPPPIACQPKNGEVSIIDSNGMEPGKSLKSQIANVQFVRSESTESKNEENGIICVNKDKERDDVSVKSRSLSLTSMNSLLSITITNDGQTIFVTKRI